MSRTTSNDTTKGTSSIILRGVEHDPTLSFLAAGGHSSVVGSHAEVTYGVAQF